MCAVPYLVKILRGKYLNSEFPANDPCLIIYYMSFAGKQIVGLVTGLAVPPIITKFILHPVLVESKYNEVDSLKHDLDYLGWNVRLREQEHGVASEALYVPTSYFQGRY